MPKSTFLSCLRDGGFLDRKTGLRLIGQSNLGLGHLFGIGKSLLLSFSI